MKVKSDVCNFYKLSPRSETKKGPLGCGYTKDSNNIYVVNYLNPLCDTLTPVWIKICFHFLNNLRHKNMDIHSGTDSSLCELVTNSYILYIDDTNLRRRKINTECSLPVWNQLKVWNRKQKEPSNTLYPITKISSWRKIKSRKKSQDKVLFLYQGEIVWVNPNNAEVGVISVVAGYFLQDFKKFKTI